MIDAGAPLGGPSDGVMQLDAGDRPAWSCTVPDAVAAIRRGEVVVVVGSARYEDEPNLLMAAEAVSVETMAFYVRHTSGVVCAAIEPEACDRLDLPLMMQGDRGGVRRRRAQTVSVDAAAEVTTGISAADRAITVRVLSRPDSMAGELRRPGHVLPLRTERGGVLAHRDHPEAAVDLARLAGCSPAGMLATVLGRDGEVARIPYLRDFCSQQRLKMLYLDQLVRWRLRNEPWLTPASPAALATDFGTFARHCFWSRFDNSHHIALTMGDVVSAKTFPIYVHQECPDGEIFGSKSCDCRSRLRAAMCEVAAVRCGVIVYLRATKPMKRGVGCVDGSGQVVHRHWLAEKALSELGVRHRGSLEGRFMRCA